MNNFLRQNAFQMQQNCSWFLFTKTRSMGHERFTEFVRGDSRFNNSTTQANSK